MLLRFIAIALASAASVVSAGQSSVIDATTGDIPATSRLGSRILSSARLLDGGNADYTWITNYSIKFHTCVTTTDYYGGYFGGDNDGDNNNNNENYNYYNNGNDDNARANWNGVYEQRLVHFKLCPASSCTTSCTNGADYVIDMNLFVQAYVESKMTSQEYNCEMVKENCYCDDANDDQMCQYACFQNAGLDYCEEEQDGGFDLAEAAECVEMEVDEDAAAYYQQQQYADNNNNNNGNYNYNNNNNNDNGEVAFFIGPYCSSNGKKINLGLFYDETCSYPAPTGTYEQLNYGVSLPYNKDNLVEANCIACTESSEYNYNNNNNNNNNQDAAEVLEVCELLYESAGKCEKNLKNVYYQDNKACDFIASLNEGISFTGVQALPAKVLAGVFAATTFAFAGLAYYLSTKSRRSNVHLAHQHHGGQFS